MKVFSSRMRKLRMLVYLKKVAVYVIGIIVILCFFNGCYHFCRQPLSGLYHSVILDDRYAMFNYTEDVSDNITFYENGSHGYLKNNITGKKVLRDVKWVVTSSEDTLACYASKGYRGYLDVRTGRPVIPAERYTKAWLFSEGLAAVMEKDSTIKFIDTHGQVVISNKSFRYPIFSYGYLFYDSLCAMTDVSGKWGIIDRKGNWVVRPEYDGIAHKDEGYWLLNKDEMKGLLDKTAKQVVPVEYRDIELTEQGVAVALKDYTMCMLNYDGTLKYKFICSGVDEVYYPTSETTSDGEDVQKLSPCKSYYTFDGHRGLMAPDGRPLTLPIFTSINGVNENLYYCRFFYADCGILLDGNGKLVNNSDIETKESGK